MNGASFVEYIADQTRGQRRLARLALHVAGHDKIVPFDVRDLLGLCDEQRAVANSFIDWFVCNPTARFGGSTLIHAASMAGLTGDTLVTSTALANASVSDAFVRIGL